MQVNLVSWTAWGPLAVKLNKLQDGSGRILLEVETGTKVSELMEQLGIPTGGSWTIVVNNEYQTPGYVLQPDDKLSLLIPLGGG